MTLTFSTRVIEGDTPQPSQEMVRQMDEQSPAGSFPAKIATQGRTWLVRAKENITMAPRCRQMVITQLEFEKGEAPALVCVETAQVPIEVIFIARALTRVGAIAHDDMTSPADYAAVRSPDTRAHVMLANFSSQSLTIAKATVLGVAEEMSESVIYRINNESESNSVAPETAADEEE